MKILIGGWFKLPRLGTQVFSALMKQGVKYDTQNGFMLSSETDIESAVKTIGSAISEPIELVVKCFVCVKGQTMILGDNKAISQYKIGDSCIGAAGHVSVKQTFSRRYRGTMVKVRACGLFPVELTPEHPVLVVSSKTIRKRSIRGGHQFRAFSKPYWKNAQDLKPKLEAIDGDYLTIPRINGSIETDHCDLHPFTNELGARVATSKGYRMAFPVNGMSAWLLGVYAAEGFPSSIGACFAIGQREITLRHKIMDAVRSLGYSPSVVRTRTTTVVVLPSRILARAFPFWCGKGAVGKRVPEFVLLHKDDSILRSFLDGYIAGDGHESGGVVAMGTVSSLLPLQLQLLCARLGLFLAVYKVGSPGKDQIEGREVRTHQAYAMVIRPRNSQSRALVFANAILTPIRRVDTTPFRGTVYNLETGDNTYLVSNAVVHNCLSVACDGCPYLEVCDRRRVSSMCLCGEHSAQKDIYETYQTTFLSTLGE